MAAVLAGAVFLTTAACVDARPPDNTMSTNPYVQFKELMKRPDIEQVSRRYEEMRAAIQDRLTSEIGVTPWKEDTATGNSSGCREFLVIEGGDDESRSLPIRYSEASVPDEKWPQAVLITTEIAGRYGFGAPQVLVDTRGDHEISIKDGYGAEIIFGTKLSTVLTILTGCHLTAEAHKRGKPAGGP